MWGRKKRTELPVGGGTDPLLAGPQAARELFKQFSALCNGFPIDAATAAAANVLLNALRQEHPTRPQAEAAFDELSGRLKSILVEHYDGAGRRRSVFPHHQIIHVPFINLRDKH